uniref:Uncharacterized protein n=1 Tax=Arundo donax TaxID=35708 RepID=A0A0A8ZFI3_ARUDO
MWATNHLLSTLHPPMQPQMHQLQPTKRSSFPKYGCPQPASPHPGYTM